VEQDRHHDIIIVDQLRSDTVVRYAQPEFEGESDASRKGDAAERALAHRGRCAHGGPARPRLQPRNGVAWLSHLQGVRRSTMRRPDTAVIVVVALSFAAFLVFLLIALTAPVKS
jgi:hypothetical protein